MKYHRYNNYILKCHISITLYMFELHYEISSMMCSCDQDEQTDNSAVLPIFWWKDYPCFVTACHSTLLYVTMETGKT